MRRFRYGGFILKILVVFCIFGPISSLVIWSLAKTWYWPALLPQKFSLFYWNKLMGSKILDSLYISLIIATITTVIAILLAIPLAYTLARKKLPAKEIIMLFFLVPQAFPQLPIYVNTLSQFYKLNLVGTVLGVAIVHVASGLIYALWIMVSVFKSIPRNQELASYNLGYSSFQTFFKITLPLAVPGIIASLILVFLYSLDEFTGSLLIGSPFVQTLSVFMYNTAMGYEMQIASVTSLLLAIPGIVMLFILEKFLKAEYLSSFGEL